MSEKGDIMPKISVIMGVYNCKRFDALVASVESIINQTFKDWELVICDDGSSNDTLLMLTKVASMDDRIRVVGYKKNRGLSGALNHCLEYAKGEYIARQDDDNDVSTPDRFEKQIRFLEEHPEYDFVGSNCTVFDQFGIVGTWKTPEMVKKEDFLWNSPFVHAALLFRRKSLEFANGYRVAKETRRCEDYDLFMRMYAEGMKGYNIQENLYHYKVYTTTNEVKYRPMKDRIDEAIVRYKGFKAMGILWRGIPYVLKPIIIGIIPQYFFRIIKKKTYN